MPDDCSLGSPAVCLLRWSVSVMEMLAHFHVLVNVVYSRSTFLLCIIDLVDLICVGWQCNVCGVITAVVFSRRRFFDITFLLISLD